MHVSLFGIVAAVLTTGAYVPQAIKTIRSRRTNDLSVVTFTMLFVGTLCWIVYAWYLKDYPLLIGNSITAALSGIIFYIILTQLKKRRKEPIV